MEIHLTPEQERIIHNAIAAGRFATPDQAIGEALRYMDEYHIKLAALHSDVQIGLDQLDRGEGIVIEDIHAYFEDIKRRGREQLKREGSSGADEN
jgi:antitoxin ParD1/3/4